MTTGSAQHTPGPWSLAKTDASIVVGSGYRICDTNGSFNPPPQDQDLANARLIAAAPDLLVSLRALVDWARQHTSPVQPNSPHALIVQAWKALDRAEGRAE